MPKASDEDVLSIAKSEERVVITNDKDFGELIFKLGRPARGIILLRTLTTNPENRFEMIKEIKHPLGFDNLILVRLSKVLAVTIFNRFAIFKAIVEQGCGSLIR